MSLAINLQAFDNKTFSTFRRSIAWNVFGPKASPCVEGWDLTYDGRRGGTLVLDDSDFIEGCSIRRPSANAIRDLYKVAQQVSSTINLDADFFVADARVLANLPDFMFALPKPPLVVSSAEELLSRLGG
jgi:hypothetical protein